MFGTKLTMTILAMAEASAEATDSNIREPQTQRPPWEESGHVPHTTIKQVEAVIFSTATTIAV